MRTFLIFGGAGFIGSHFTKLLLKYKEDRIVVADDLSSGFRRNLDNNDQIVFEKFSIKKHDLIDSLFFKYKFNIVINFVMPDDIDTINLLSCCKTHDVERFIQISNDKIYNERVDTNYPHSMLERIVISYGSFYNISTIIARLSNNYGENQAEDKFIPSIIKKAVLKDIIQVYGDGRQIRNWTNVSDSCLAIEMIMNFGENETIYNVCADNNIENIFIIRKILKYFDLPMGVIDYVDDLQDKRYILNNSSTRALGWRHKIEFEDGLMSVIKHYKHKFEVQNEN